MDKKAIAIIGMHRSGTSVITSWLQACGLNIGDRLLAGNIGNINGHYEDLDFLSFHEGLFLKNSLNYLNANTENMLIDDLDIHLAQEIINKKIEKNNIFGWKDPRTCIFLNNLWNKTDNNIYYLFIYRPFGQIINSLYNRHIKMLNKDHKNQLISNRLIKKMKNKIHLKILKKRILEDYCRMYINYMEQVLKFYHNLDKKNKFIAIDIGFTIKNSIKVLNTINNNWSISLKIIDLGLIFKMEQFTTKSIDISIIDNVLVDRCLILDEKVFNLTKNISNQTIHG